MEERMLWVVMGVSLLSESECVVSFHGFSMQFGNRTTCSHSMCVPLDFVLKNKIFKTKKFHGSFTYDSYKGNVSKVDFNCPSKEIDMDFALKLQRRGQKHD